MLTPRYLIAGTESGGVYVLESTRVVEGSERAWLSSKIDKQMLTKKREAHGFRGYSATDNVMLLNKAKLESVNRRIAELDAQISEISVVSRLKLDKKVKKFEKHKEMIDRDLQADLLAQYARALTRAGRRSSKRSRPSSPPTCRHSRRTCVSSQSRQSARRRS